MQILIKIITSGNNASFDRNVVIGYYSSNLTKHQQLGYCVLSVRHRSLRGVVANVLSCNIVISEFEFQFRYYVHFPKITPKKGMNHCISADTN